MDLLLLLQKRGASAPVPGSETKLPGTGADDNAVGAATWSAPGNITAEDGSAASAILSGVQKSTHYLRATNFGFSIPAGATINGVTVEVSRCDSSESEQVHDGTLKLVKGGIIGGDDKASEAIWFPGFSFETATYGGAVDLWGLVLTPADVNASNFGVVLTAVGVTAGEPLVDFVRMTIDYVT
jgi:hypothetical protein